MNIFLLGATPEITPEPNQDPISKLAKTGGNTGNQIIAHALLGQINYKDISWDYCIDPHKVNERFDMFVIAAANFLFPSFDFGGMAEYIEKADLPVAIVGLGAQAPNYDPDIKLSPGTERFLKVVAERAVSIGVRGPFTQEVLNRRGIHNVTAIGCPSYYMRGGQIAELPKSDFGKVRRISVNASRDVIGHAFDPAKMLEIVREIYRAGIAWGADFIAQSENAEIWLAERASPETANSALDEICGFLRGIADDAKVRDWASSHMRVFFRVTDWIQAVRGYDFVFGNRFHGNMVALQHGVPACVVCHDTRTEEMCRFLAMPFVNIVDLSSIRVQALYDNIDMAAFNRRYKRLYPQYVEFLRANNLSVKLRWAA
jgi:Polysaccharide pyruvyl transferase